MERRVREEGRGAARRKLSKKKALQEESSPREREVHWMDEGEPVAGVSSSLSELLFLVSSSCPGSQFSSLHASVQFTSPLPLSERRFHHIAAIKKKSMQVNPTILILIDITTTSWIKLNSNSFSMNWFKDFVTLINTPSTPRVSTTIFFSSLCLSVFVDHIPGLQKLTHILVSQDFNLKW